MATADTGPLIPRRRLGAAFRELREARGETLQQSAKALLFSPSKLSRIENGLAGEPHPRDVRDLIEHFDINGEHAASLKELAEAGRQPGWWQLPPYEFTGDIDTFISYESAASRIRGYSPMLIPGLLQTRGYARSALSTFLRNASEEIVDLHVEARMERQRQLRERSTPTPQLHVIHEAALELVADSPGVMEEQLEALLRIFDHPASELRVIPFSAGLNKGITLPLMTIFEFSSSTDSNIVSIERITNVDFFDRDRTVTKYTDIFDDLLPYCLDATQSRSFVERKQQKWREG